MKRKLIFSVLMVLILPTLAVWGQNRKVDLKENLPFEEVLKMAKAQDKLIFLDFGSLTCKPCLYIKQKVLTLDSVADFINERFVSVDYNTGAEKNRLQKVYNVVGEPVLLILDQQGNLMHRMAGKMEGDQLMKRFRQGLDPERNSVTMDKKYNIGNRDTQFILDYMETLHASGETNIMNGVSKEFLSGPLENLKKPEIFPIFFKYVEDVGSKEILYLMDHRTEFSKLYGEGLIEGKINKLFTMSSIKYLYGHSNPMKDSTFITILNYLRTSDHPKSTEWLCYLVPAQYKYEDWPRMAQEINNIYSFNMLKGKSGISYKDMMITQFMMYCHDPEGLKYAIEWCQEINALNNDQKHDKTIAMFEERVKKGKPVEEDDGIDWAPVN